MRKLNGARIWASNPDTWLKIGLMILVLAIMIRKYYLVFG
jgi:hypothetical protein